METLEATLTGTLPLIMHNGQLADPLNKWSKEIAKLSSVRNRTDEQTMEMRKMEWFGSLYLDEKGRIALPGSSVMACLVDGAKKTKHGQAVKRGVIVSQEFFPLIYEGPTNLETLWGDSRFVDMRPAKLNKSASVVRTRPIFRSWSVDVAFFVSEDEIDIADVVAALEYAGERKAIGDYRPQYGRFEVSE